MVVNALDECSDNSGEIACCALVFSRHHDLMNTCYDLSSISQYFHRANQLDICVTEVTNLLITRESVNADTKSNNG